MQILFWLLGGFRAMALYVGGLIKAAPWQSAVVALIIALLLMVRAWSIDHRNLTNELAEANGLIADERAAHQQTIRNVAQGRKAAAELDRKNAARVAAEAAAISERTVNELESRTRTYADRSARLLAHVRALEAAAGGGGTTPVPSDPNATCRAFGATDCKDLAARMTDAQASIDRLIALQAWATGVTAININGAPE